MVASTSRMHSDTIKRQPVHQQKRKCTRADPTQTRILLKNYEAQARPSAAQFADMSQETNLPVEWIKKWFLRKRKADGKNRTLTPTMPTFVENEPPARDGQTLGHAHSKFWSVDAFVAADSNSFSPSVGHIPKFYGHHRHNLPSGNPDDRTTDSRANEEEREIMSQEASAGIGDGHTASCRSVETTTPTTYNLREALLGVDAFPRHLPPSVDEDASGSHSEQFNVTLAVDDPGSTMFLEASSTEYSVYPDDSHDEPFSGSESITDLGFTLTNYSLSSGSSPFDTIDDLILASKDLEFISAISYDATKDLGLDSFDPATGRLNPNPGSFSDFPDVSNCVASTFGDSSASYESLLLQATSQDLTGDSVSLTDCSSLLDIDFYLGAAPIATKHELERTSALGLSLVNFDDETSDPAAAFAAGFGGFNVGGNDNDVKETTEDIDSGESWWTDALDTMFV